MADDGDPRSGKTPAGTDPGVSVGSDPYLLNSGWAGFGPLVSMGQTYGDANALVTAFGKQNVQIELQTLTAFATKVEALLAAMEGSEAAPYKLEAQRLTRENFVSGEQPERFSEAVALNSAYSKVHSQLVKLHKDFTAQIQAMQKAVLESADSYGTSDANAAAAQNAVAKSTGVTKPSGSAPQDSTKL
ncbi:hypothetical protein AB0F92_27480 [Kitasatospora aureofaciens]|uniref:hypothetical protein n=1 Tax=Kitasatospora aureofaciens TaxID=1894 RepID=UPI003402C65D